MLGNMFGAMGNAVGGIMGGGGGGGGRPMQSKGGFGGMMNRAQPQRGGAVGGAMRPFMPPMGGGGGGNTYNPGMMNRPPMMPPMTRPRPAPPTGLSPSNPPIQPQTPNGGAALPPQPPPMQPPIQPQTPNGGAALPPQQGGNVADVFNQMNTSLNQGGGGIPKGPQNQPPMNYMDFMNQLQNQPPRAIQPMPVRQPGGPGGGGFWNMQNPRGGGLGPSNPRQYFT